MGVKRMGLGFIRVTALTLLTATLGMGCGKKGATDSFDGIACGASDQYHSYMNPMDSTLVQTISVDSAFDAEEVAKIQAAVDTWNSDSRSAVGHDLFRTQVLGISAQAVPVAANDCSFPGAHGAFSIVKITDQETWTNLGFSKNNPGVTIRCAQNRDFAEKQVVLLNTANMQSIPQIFQSVILHELGHAIGLDHSCDAANANIPGFAGCKKPGTDESYKEAVMYPYVNPADLRESLRPNDRERTTCALNYRP